MPQNQKRKKKKEKRKRKNTKLVKEKKIRATNLKAELCKRKHTNAQT